MYKMNMTRRLISAATVAVLFTASAAFAQQPGRIRGQIEKADGAMPDRHGPWDGRPNSTMTNAYVEDMVQSRDGDTLMVKYKDGEKKVIVTPQTVIAAAAPG